MLIDLWTEVFHQIGVQYITANNGVPLVLGMLIYVAPVVGTTLVDGYVNPDVKKTLFIIGAAYQSSCHHGGNPTAIHSLLPKFRMFTPKKCLVPSSSIDYFLVGFVCCQTIYLYIYVLTTLITVITIVKYCYFLDYVRYVDGTPNAFFRSVITGGISQALWTKLEGFKLISYHCGYERVPGTKDFPIWVLDSCDLLLNGIDLVSTEFHTRLDVYVGLAMSSFVCMLLIYFCLYGILLDISFGALDSSSTVEERTLQFILVACHLR